MSVAFKNDSDDVRDGPFPRSVPGGPDRSHEDSKRIDDYQRIKGRYLALCRRYGLNPFDLDILSLSVSRLPRHDKTSLVGYIIRLIKLERSLKSLIPHGLFPLTVSESERSGYLVPTHHME